MRSIILQMHNFSGCKVALFAKLVSPSPLAPCEDLGSDISVFIDVTRALLAA